MNEPIRRTPLFEVWIAGDRAIKKFAAAVRATELEIRRFREEAEAARKLSHPNVLAVLEHTDAGAESQQVVEYFDGADLMTLAEQLDRQGVSIPSEVALHVGLGVASALAHAHGRRTSTGRADAVTHGFIGPRSVLVSAGGEVKLTDFRVGAERAEPRGASQEGGPARMYGGSDPRADIAALGRLLRWLIVDHGGVDRTEIGRRLQEGEFDLHASIVDRDLSRLVDRASRAGGEGGYDSVFSLADDLEHALELRHAAPQEWLGRWAARLRGRAGPASPPPPAETRDARRNIRMASEVDEEPQTGETSGQSTAPRIGLIVDGRYRLVEPIGHGATGTVYRAVQLNVMRDVALKTMVAGALGNVNEVMRRFENEARVISQLRHPNTLKLIDFGKMGEDELYIVTELLTGATLEEELKQTPMEQARALRIISEIADALSEAHSKNIIHRDIKPRNVFIDHLGTRELVKVLDFGLAKVIGQRTQTAVGLTVGTPSYMSPEQAIGGEITTATDIYSLGVTAYELLAGDVPFTSAHLQGLLLKHVHEAPPRFRDRRPPIEVHPEVEALVMQMLAKKPEDRPKSASEVCARIAEVLPRVSAGSTTAGSTTAAPVINLAGVDGEPPRRSALTPITQPDRAAEQTQAQSMTALAPRRVSPALIALGSGLVVVVGLLIYLVTLIPQQERAAVAPPAPVTPVTPVRTATRTAEARPVAAPRVEEPVLEQPAAEEPRAKTKPKLKTAAPDPKDSWPAMQGELQRALSARGLELEDLQLVDGASGPYSRWLAARSAEDLRAGRAALEELTAAIGKAAVDARVLTGRLDRVSKLFQSIARGADQNQVMILERKYLGLASRVTKARDPEAIAELAREIAAFEAELRRR